MYEWDKKVPGSQNHFENIPLFPIGNASSPDKVTDFAFR